MAKSDELPWGEGRAARLAGEGVGLSGVSLRGLSLLDRWYFAARDSQWRTVPLSVVRDHEVQADGFVARFAGVSTSPSLPLTVDAEFIANPRGITARLTVTAEGSFEYNRIGWCLLHPASTHAGAPFRLSRDSRSLTGRLPAEIAPQPHVDGAPRSFLPAFDEMLLTLDGGDVEYRYAGDLFEIEDQRNWSDPSFKIYSTPLADGFPRSAVTGQRFEQTVSMTIRAPSPAVAGSTTTVRPTSRGHLPVIRLGQTTAFPPDAFRPSNGFVELNRARPELRRSTLVLGINGAVHAADDQSVMDTTQTHGEIVRQITRLNPGCTVVIDPLDFSNQAGEWYSSPGVFAPAPPTPSVDPRRTGEFAVTWLIASIASCVGAGAHTLAYFDRSVESAPVGRVIKKLGMLAGAAVRERSAPRGVRGFEVASELWLANTTGAAVEVDGTRLPPFGFAIRR